MKLTSFFLRFSVRKLLIKLRRQFYVRKIFRTQVFVGCFHFVYKITISEMRNLFSRLLFIKTCSLAGR